MKKLSLIFSMMFLGSVAMSTEVQAQDNKKWSPQAKGAVIGAGTGAAAGAIIHKKNRVVGGVVGGAVGAAAGYGVGKIIDNKNKKKEAERQAEFERTVAANRTYAYSSSNQSAGTVARKASAPKKAAAASTPAIMNSFAAQNQPQIMGVAYLPNEYYGDNSKPYADSEIRRKSW